jgi:hypothetical protein
MCQASISPQDSLSIHAPLSLPDEFVCPITQEIMKDPVVTRTGMSFERSAIFEWLLNHNNTNPLTREPLGPKDLISHRSLKARIEAWQSVNSQLDSDTEESTTCDNDNDEGVLILTIIKGSGAKRNFKSASNSTRRVSRGGWLRLRLQR